MRDDGHLLVDERDRAVLHLPGRIAFGVDVGDFLQLQRAFERDRIVDAAAEIQEVRCGCRTSLAISSIAFAVLQRVFEDLRQLHQRVDVLAAFGFGDSVPRTSASFSAKQIAARRAAS